MLSVCALICPSTFKDRVTRSKTALARAVEPRTGNQHVPAAHREARDGAVRSEPRSASHQRNAIGVDESAAVAGDAKRIGDDDVGLASHHFGEAPRVLRFGLTTSLRMTFADWLGLVFASTWPASCD